MAKKSVSIHDIARMANTSACTVSKVLSGKARESRISREREKAVLAIAERHKFRPSAAARSMRLRRTGHVGVLILNSPYRPLTTPGLYEVILGIDSELSRRDCTTLLVRVSDVKSMEDESRVFRERVLDGVIVMDNQTPKICRRVENLVTHCIFAETSVWGEQNSIRRDEEWAGRCAAEKLIEHGYRRLLYFGEPAEKEGMHFSLYERFAGARQVAAACDVPMVSHTYYRAQGIEAALDDLTPGTGVIAYSVAHATAIALAAGRKGLIAGATFGLVSCDEAIELQWSWPTLSHVKFDRFELGRQAARMLLQRMKGNGMPVPSRRLQGEWVAGGTLGGESPDRPG